MDEPKVDINDIKNFFPPSYSEIKTMELSEIKKWMEKIYPYYFHRSEILKELGFEEWRKVIGWPFIYTLFEERSNHVNGNQTNQSTI